MAARTGFATPRRQSGAPEPGSDQEPSRSRCARWAPASPGRDFLPFLIITTNAIKSPQEYAANGPLSLPSGIYLNGIFDFWNRVDFTSMLINSTVISLSVAILSMVLSLLNGFAMGIAGCGEASGYSSSS